MTTDENAVRKLRQNMLASFDDMAVDGDALRALVEQSRGANQQILMAHRVDEMYPGFESDRLHWTSRYYDQQKSYASHNFSRERLAHLIEVREHLQKQGVKGFTVRSPAQQTAPAGTMSRSESATSVISNYQPSENLRKFVEDGELRQIRAALRYELNNNRLSRQKLLDALDWASRRAKDVCEIYAETAFARALDHDRSNWTADYYDIQTDYLSRNFSAERYRHLVDVRLYLRERGTEGFIPTNNAIGNTSEAVYQRAASASIQAPREIRGRSMPPLDHGSPLLKTAFLVGGALAVAVILLMSIMMGRRP